MNHKKLLRLDWGRCLDKRKTAALIIFFILAALVLQLAIGQYRNDLEEIKRFKEYEKARFEYSKLFVLYTWFGFRLYYMPGPMGALFSDAGTIPANLNVIVDTSERLTIFESFLGRNAFTTYTTFFFNFTGWLYLFGSLIALFYGLNAFKDKEFLKLLTSIKGSRQGIFGLILLSRLLFLSGIYLILALLAGFLYWINGLSIHWGGLILYFMGAFLMAVFFLITGMGAGMVKKKMTRALTALATWILCIIFLPAVVGFIVQIRAESLVSTYKLDYEKFKLFYSIEKRAKEMAGRLDVKNSTTPLRQRLHEYFWKNEFQWIFNHEQAMINDMKDVITLHGSLSSLLPTSFFLSLSNEISGRGYQNLMAFYEHAFKHKKGFIQYYAEKVFYTNEKTVKPYLQWDQLVMLGSSKLPRNFGFGILISIFWLLGLTTTAWILFNRLLNRGEGTDQKMFQCQDWVLPLERCKPSETLVVLTKNQERVAQLLDKLRRLKAPFIFVPPPDTLPGDVTVKGLLDIFELSIPEDQQPLASHYVYSLTLDEKAWLLFFIIQAQKTQYVVFDNYMFGLSDQQINRFADALNIYKQGKKVVYYCSNIRTPINVEDDLIRVPGEPKSLW